MWKIRRTTDTADPANGTQGWSQCSADQQYPGGSSLPGSRGSVANKTVTVTDRVPILREPQGAGRSQDGRDEQMSHILQNSRKGQILEVAELDVWLGTPS